MATRANIELYDGQSRQALHVSCRKRAVLLHEWDSDPWEMGPELERQLQKCKRELSAQRWRTGWDGQSVAALLVRWSVEHDPVASKPCCVPCLDLEPGIESLWRIFLGPQYGRYELQCFRVEWDWTHRLVKKLTPVDWRSRWGKPVAH